MFVAEQSLTGEGHSQVWRQQVYYLIWILAISLRCLLIFGYLLFCLGWIMKATCCLLRYDPEFILAIVNFNRFCLYLWLWKAREPHQYLHLMLFFPLRTFLFVSLWALFSCIFLMVEATSVPGSCSLYGFWEKRYLWKKRDHLRMRGGGSIQAENELKGTKEVFSAAALSAFCCARLAWHCSSVGRAYQYLYLGVGEGIAWLIGWALILEYTIDSSVVARDIFLNLALFLEAKISCLLF